MGSQVLVLIDNARSGLWRLRSVPPQPEVASIFCKLVLTVTRPAMVCGICGAFCHNLRFLSFDICSQHLLIQKRSVQLESRTFADPMGTQLQVLLTDKSRSGPLHLRRLLKLLSLHSWEARCWHIY